MFATAVVLAQDSHYRPEGQQFPAPGCYTVKGAWEGGAKLCNAKTTMPGSLIFTTGAMNV